jgi:peptide/nickel transport system substrate-binding protein
MVRIGRRRVLGYGAAGISAAWLAACGGGGNNSSSSGDTSPRATLVQNQPVASAAAGETAKPGGSAAIRIATTAPLDPTANTTYTAQTIASFAFSRLMKFKTDNTPTTADNFEVTPDLASGVEQTADGLQFTFKLRQAAFHNKGAIAGRKVDSEDVKASLERFRTDPKNTNRNVFGSPQTPLVDSVETPDAQTVVFKLAKPFGPFLPLVATAQYLWIMPKELAAGAYDPAKDQIGTGPFMYDSTQPDVEIKYKKNPNYFISGRPYMDEFRHVVLPDSVQESVQFQAKRLDVAAIPYDQIDEIKRSNPDAKSFETKPGTLAFLAAQQRGNTVFRDERLRKALSMSVDRDGLLKLAWNGAGVYQNMVPSSFGKWWVDPKSADAGPGAPFYKFNMKEAIALLKAAGYDENKKLSFKYIYTPNGYTQRFNQLAEATASMLKETKVLDPTIVTADYQGEYIKTGGIFFGAYEGVFFGLQSGYNDAHDYLFNTLHTASQRNHVGVNDPQVDDLINKEQGTTGVDDRLKLVHDIQNYAMDKMYYIMMSYGPDYTFLQPWVRNYFARRGYGAAAESFLEMWLNK